MKIVRAPSLLVFAILLPALGGERPHRRLATKRFFTEQSELNHPLAALTQNENLRQFLKVSRMIGEKAVRNGRDPNAAQAAFWQNMVKRIGRENPALRERVQNLMRPLAEGRPGADVGAEQLEQLQQFARLLEDPALREPVQRAMLSAMERAQRSPRNAATFRDSLRRVRGVMERAGISRPTIDRLGALFRRVEAQGSRIAEGLTEFTRGTVGAAPSMRIPHLVLPLAFVAFVVAALLSLALLRKKREKPVVPPPIPQFERLAPHDFPGALLAIYRRLLFEVNLPFRGKPVEELLHDVSRHFPERTPGFRRLNAAFYEIWYAGSQKSPDELAELNALLAQTFKHARPGATS